MNPAVMYAQLLEAPAAVHGDIGIGGDPVSVLRRLHVLLQPGGAIVAEVEPPGAPTDSGRVRLESGETVSGWFPWAHVGADGVEGVARSVELTVDKRGRPAASG